MPKFLNCFLAAVICSSTVLSPIYASFPYGSQKVRGVNLGGWLVLEPWITPSLFDNTNDDRIVDEYTFGQYQHHDDALNTLQQHWDTWITESDFAAIAAAGLNHVRLPIGYWAFEVSGGEPFVQGQLPYLTKAVDWAQNHGLKLIIDLHGAPGSQNGYDNSGRRGQAKWHTDDKNVQRTNAIIQTLANKYKNSDVVSVIAALNEPAGYLSQELLDVTKQYWHDSYQTIRGQGNNIVMIHDAFQPLSSWDDFMPPPQYQGVILDTHIYQMFSDEGNKMSYDQHIQAACDRQSDLTARPLWTVVGEWVPAPNDCAKYLNGLGSGSRYEQSVGSCSGWTGRASTFSNSYKTFLRQFWEAQAMTYEKAQGWIQWTWKAEYADEWSYQAGLANGWIPKNPTDYKYPNICG